MELKYIIPEDGSPVIFKDPILHSEAACGLGKILSAGFLRIRYTDDKFDCHVYGESVSLGIGSDKDEDVIRLNRFFNYL